MKKKTKKTIVSLQAIPSPSHTHFDFPPFLQPVMQATVMMVWAKRIYILMIKVNKLFSSEHFLKEIKKTCSLWKFVRTRKSLFSLTSTHVSVYN